VKTKIKSCCNSSNIIGSRTSTSKSQLLASPTCVWHAITASEEILEQIISHTPKMHIGSALGYVICTLRLRSRHSMISSPWHELELCRYIEKSKYRIVDTDISYRIVSVRYISNFSIYRWFISIYRIVSALTMIFGMNDINCILESKRQLTTFLF